MSKFNKHEKIQNNETNSINIKKRKPKLSIIIVGTFFRKIWFLIAEQLRKRGYKIEFITTSFIVSKDAAKFGYKVINLNDCLKDYSKEYEESKYFNILRLMDIEDEDTIFKRQKKIYGAKTEYIRRIAFIYYKFFEDYFQHSKPDFLLYNGDDTLNVLGEKQAHRHGIKTLHTDCVGLIINNLHWDKSVYHRDWVKEKYLKEKMSDSERGNAEKYIKTMIEKRQLMGLNIRPIHSIYFATKYLKLLYHYLHNYLLKWLFY